ncbi:DUF4279 domain-containing protein [Streptomyces sp. NPDC050856]|uniref:DUF4279 domain-containing protein n=1 Tax=Streptomyces sp. NPDC050856 TaxID=3154939 RepID=UPI0034066F1A
MISEEGKVVADRAGSVDRWKLTDVALVIKKADLDPGEVTARLDLQPSAVKSPGIDRWNPGGGAEGQWRYQCDERTATDFSAQLDIVLKAAEQRSHILASLQEEGFEVFLLVGGFAAHDARLPFSSAELQRIARLNMSLRLLPNLNER